MFNVFGVPKPPRLSSRQHETLKTQNTPFPFLTSFWMHFGVQNGCKILPKCIQKTNNKSDEFCIEKNRKMDPIWGSRGGPTNQLFTPKIQSGTPWSPQGAPESLQKVPWTIFDRIWSQFHDILIVFRLFFLCFPTQFRIEIWHFLQVAQQNFDWRTPEYFMKSTTNQSINQSINR